MIKEATLLKWAKVGLCALCGIALIMLCVIFMLNLSVRDKVYSADMVLNSQKIVETENNVIGYIENALEYNVRLKFPEFRALLRSKSISNIHINDIAWDSAIDTNALSNINQGGQNLWFNSTQDLSKMQSQSIGAIEYKIDFYPFMKHIIVYVILALLLIFALMSKNPSKYATNLALLLIIVALSMASDMNFWSAQFGSWIDNNVFRYIGQAMIRGEMPYRDAFDHKGPLLYLYNYFGNLMLKDIRGVWIFEIVSVAVAVIFGYKMARLFTNRLCAIIAIILSFNGYFFLIRGGNIIEQYTLPFLFISLYIFVRYFRIGFNKSETIICGICFGAVCLLRLNIISLWAVFVAIIFFMELKRCKFNFALFFTLGFAIIVVPILSWLYLGGAFREFIEQYWIFNVKYYTNVANFNDKINLFLIFIYEQPLLALSFIFVALKAYKERQIFDYGFLVFIILTLLATSMSGFDHHSYRIVFFPIYAYGMVIFTESILQELKGCKSLRAISAITFILILLISPFLKEIRSSLNTIINGKFLAHLEVPERYKHIIVTISKYTNDSDKISVLGNDVAIYLMSDRMPINKFVYTMQPIEMRKEYFELYKKDLNEKLPKMVIIGPTYRDRVISKMFNEISSLSKLGYIEVEKDIFVRKNSKINKNL